MTEQQQGELNNALFEAAEIGNVDECQRLIQSGANVNAVYYDGWTLLHWAAHNGHFDVCQLLINEERTNVNATNRYGKTPLHWAAWHGHAEVCHLLIERGANVNAIERHGMTPLHLAALNGRVEVCRLLIQADANVHATNNNGRTPLQYAAANGHVEVCRLFIERGANVNVTNGDSKTPLDVVIDRNITPVLVYFYVHGVVNFHQPDHTGQMPWDRLTAQEQGTLTEAMEDHQEKIAILQTRGLPIELARLVMGYL